MRLAVKCAALAAASKGWSRQNRRPGPLPSHRQSPLDQAVLNGHSFQCSSGALTVLFVLQLQSRSADSDGHPLESSHPVDTKYGQAGISDMDTLALCAFEATFPAPARVGAPDCHAYWITGQKAWWWRMACSSQQAIGRDPDAAGRIHRGNG
jgi:hypothetical protein